MQIWCIFKYEKDKNCFINGSFWEINYAIMFFSKSFVNLLIKTISRQNINWINYLKNLKSNSKTLTGMKKIIFIITSLLFPSIFFARTYTQFSRYSVNEGLSEINVQCMLQDKKGQMWFGTFDGLNMFNGYSFKTYKTNPGQLFGLENYRVNLIREDKDGYLWIITYDGRVYRFDPRTEKFMQVPQCQEEFKKFKNRLEMVYTLNDGSIWLSGKDAGCFKVQNLKESNKINVWYFNEENELLSSNKMNRIFQDNSKNTWLLTNYGLNLVKPNSTKPIQLFREKSTGAFFSITQAGNYVWIGGDNGKLRYYDQIG